MLRVVGKTRCERRCVAMWERREDFLALERKVVRALAVEVVLLKMVV